MSEVTRVLVVLGGRTVDAEHLSSELGAEEEVEVKVIAPAITATIGDGGEADPLGAIEDALVAFAADQIVLVPHQPDRQTWAEEGLLEEVRERVPVPVRELEPRG